MQLRKKIAVATVGLFGLINQVLAAVPADVTTAMADMKTDALAVATAFLVAFIAIVAFAYMRKGAK